MPRTTEAWVLYPGEPGSKELSKLAREPFTVPDLGPEDVWVKTLYGCWEGNMGHALERSPVDICVVRGEDRLVMGNAGVVEILECGPEVTTVKPGQKAILFCNGEWDEYGYPKKIFGFDCKGTVGLLARETKLHQKQVIAIPEENTFALERWAAFSLRYVTAWSNWRLAYAVLRNQLTEDELPDPIVWGWGGGVSLAQLHLARLQGCHTVQVSSAGKRRDAAERLGIGVVDRGEFRDLQYDEKRYKTDEAYRDRYKVAEKRFLEIVEERTNGRGVHIFIDYVGSPVLRATLKALTRQGVITTAGWKEGMQLWLLRAIECIDRHQHVHTHYARYVEGVRAVHFALANEWLPEVDERIYEYDEIPELARDYLAGDFVYFPCYKVND